MTSETNEPAPAATGDGPKGKPQQPDHTEGQRLKQLAFDVYEKERAEQLAEGRRFGRKPRKVIVMDVNRAYNARVNVTITESARKDFAGLPRVIQARIGLLFERLQAWPNVSGAKPLTGHLAGRYRLRTGAYRLQFRVREGGVTVEKIGHRKDVYEE